MSADEIDSEVQKIRTSFRPATLKVIQKDGEAAAEQRWREKASQLSKLLLAPLELHLKNVDDIIISPEGMLWTVPWEALVTSNGRYLIEEFGTRYVLSGRELVSGKPPSDSISHPVIFADPDFNMASDRIAASKARNLRQLRSAHHRFAPLHSSAAEAAAIRPSIEAYANSPVSVLTQQNAQEAAFKDLLRPKVLVMSTHGYFESHPVDRDSADGEAIADPLLRCGLALVSPQRCPEPITESAPSSPEPLVQARPLPRG